jgi:predicted ATPase with chaperone activity
VTAARERQLTRNAGEKKTVFNAQTLPKMVRKHLVISAHGKKLLENAIPGWGPRPQLLASQVILVAWNTRSRRKIYRRAPLTCIVPAWYG